MSLEDCKCDNWDARGAASCPLHPLDSNCPICNIQVYRKQLCAKCFYIEEKKEEAKAEIKDFLSTLKSYSSEIKRMRNGNLAALDTKIDELIEFCGKFNLI